MRASWFDVTPEMVAQGLGGRSEEAVKEMILASAGAAGAAQEQGGGQLTQATRHARRVYVGGLPPSANEDRISSFFSHALAAVGGVRHLLPSRLFMQSGGEMRVDDHSWGHVYSVSHSKEKDWLQLDRDMVGGCLIVEFSNAPKLGHFVALVLMVKCVLDMPWCTYKRLIMHFIIRSMLLQGQ
jgi:hypothetical protein